MHRRDHHVEFGEHLVGQVERAVGEDVHLHSREDLERRHLGVDLGDLVDLLAQAAFVEPVRDGESGRVVGDRHPFVAQRCGGLGHRPQRRPSVGPGGVAVAVAAQALQHRASRPDRHPAALLQRGEVAVVGAVEGLGDHPGRARPYPVELGEGALGRPGGELAVADSLGHLQRPQERPHLRRRRQLPVEIVDR